MTKRNQIKTDRILSLVSFILGNRPDEFGLVPHREGWVSYKELLLAIHEEPGWSYLRQSHLHEILIGKGRTLFEWDEKRLRAVERRWELRLEEPSPSVPKILHIGIRKRAHAYVMEQGLKSDHPLVFSPTREMALRIGRRRDPNPILLEIMTGPAQSEGLPFFAFGQLFLASEISPRFISGPPVSKEAEGKKQPEKMASAPPDFLAGTFMLDAQRDPDRSRPFGGKKQRGWKEEARKLRRKRG